MLASASAYALFLLGEAMQRLCYQCHSSHPSLKCFLHPSIFPSLHLPSLLPHASVMEVHGKCLYQILMFGEKCCIWLYEYKLHNYISNYFSYMYVPFSIMVTPCAI